MSLRKRDQILRERDRLAPFLERAFNLSEDDLAAMEMEAAKGQGKAVVERFLRETNVSGLPNPLVPVTDFDREYPHYHVLKVLRDPEYFPLTCKLLYDIDIEAFQHVVLKVLSSKHMILMVACRGGGKSFLLALFAHLKMLFHQGWRIVVVGSAFRQSKVIFEYMEQIWSKAPILRDLVGGGKGRNNREQGPRRDVDRCDFIIGDSICSALPVGPDGSKIRGMRANTIFGDEFGSINEEVFNNVVFGFASVGQNPVRDAREHRKVRALKAMGLWDEEDETRYLKTASHNQVVLTGTADYAFGHFAKTYRRWRDTIYSRGDARKLAEVYPEGVPLGIDYRDYACVRLPVGLLPPRYMQDKIVGAAKGKISKAQYLREYGAVFPMDSDGFFKRSLIEMCVVGKSATPVIVRDQEVLFYPSMRGAPNTYHVIAVDPASEKDKLAIVVLAMCGTHRRVVHVWTTDRRSHQAMKAVRSEVEGNYYQFAASKVRQLMHRFATSRIAVDAQGGGIPIMEALENLTADEKQRGEQPIYPVKDPPGTPNRKPTDHKDGLHVIEIVQFANAEWTADANHTLKADFEQSKVLFPLWDTASEELALFDDKQAGRVKIVDNEEVRLADTLLDVAQDIEELKNELTTIQHSRLPSGRERWDLPEIKLEGGKKGRQRKDRYSALLMANKVARDIMNADELADLHAVGTVKGRQVPRTGEPAPFFQRKPGWIKDDHTTGVAVSRKRHR